MLRSPRRFKLVPLAALLALATPVLAARPAIKDWATYHNPRHGFSIAYPGSVFVEKAGTQPSDDGRVLVSRDGVAQLLFGAFPNEEQSSMRDYRDFLMRENYKGAAFDYTPVRDRYFVLSGERDGVMFYERVSFTCGGKLINSWAMLYPVAERGFYDRVVEAVARTYTPGAGKTGSCD